jgi:phosphoribosyl 1,2-cyclic phosphodiesterase
MIEVCALASGSNGNSYYIGNENEAILIDAGINCKQLLARLDSRGIDPSKIKAVFITHEHTDHICGVRVFCNKHNIPAFFSYGTFNNTSSRHKPKLFRFIELNSSVTIGGFVIYSYPKKHDASEPCSFRIDHNGLNVMVLTDLGEPTQPVIDHLQYTDILFLESNYDEKMLWEGAYPWPLKKRISSDVGHLSNVQALEFIKEHAPERLRMIFLSHLSGENNKPQIASETFGQLASKYQLITTSRHEASDLVKFG